MFVTGLEPQRRAILLQKGTGTGDHISATAMKNTWFVLLPTIVGSRTGCNTRKHWTVVVVYLLKVFSYFLQIYL